MSVVLGSTDRAGETWTVATDQGRWKSCTFTYVVPDGQTTTRLRFISGPTQDVGYGNLLDSVAVPAVDWSS